MRYYKNFIDKLASGAVILMLVLFCSILTPIAFAQENKSYEYTSIEAVVSVQPDSTLQVKEKQTFKFNGSYHQAFRHIPLNKISGISHMEVFDENGTPLTYSTKRLDKTQSSSWGKFTTYRQSGQQYIEWYYNLADTEHTWTIAYDVLGATEFLKDGARVYWNIFSDFDVPVRQATAEVEFPKTLRQDQVGYYAYRNSGTKIASLFSGDSVTFASNEFSPLEAFTVDVTLPQGVVSKNAYFGQWFLSYFGYIAGFASIVIALIAGFLVWLFREKLPQGRRTIVPEYEPPQNLKPAMAEIILTERLSNKGLTATIIDLAVRGYVKIEEEESKGMFADFKKNASASLGKIMLGIRFGIFIFVAILLVVSMSSGNWSSLLVLIPVIFVAGIFWLVLYAASKQRDYRVVLQKDKNDPGLEDYEREYLEILTEGKNEFSTRDMRLASNTDKRELYNKLQKLKDTAFKETSADTHAFYVGPYQGKKVAVMWSSLLIVFILGSIIHGKMGWPVTQWEILAVGVLLSAFGLWTYVKYETRLNEEGIKLKEDWLGFKLFLETAERYRLQNLTPDMFQKFLPYAMIFGIEKKWAKAFEQMHVEPPSWYAGSYVAYAAGSQSFASQSGGFSPSVFSTSFSSAFTSAFASAGASGASGGGGGGSAGGGGGGGGGGAS